MSIVATEPGELRIHLQDHVECRHIGGGTVRLRGPVMRRGGLSRFLGWMLRAPSRCEVELDEIGAFIVERFDGRALSAIAAELSARYKLTRREAEVSLGDFLKALVKRRLVRIEAPKSQT